MATNLIPQSPPLLTPSTIPNSPPGMAVTQKEGVRIIHSSQYKHSDEFKGRKVMILGCGETSMDLSYAAIKNGATEVTLW